MNIKQPFPKYGILHYFKGILHYSLLFCFSLIFMPIPSVEAKTKKVAIKSDQVQQKKGKNKKKKKNKPTKGEKRRCDIIAYTSLCLENPRKLAKYPAFYHQGSHCIGLDINQIDISNNLDIIQNIYCGRRLMNFANQDKPATFPLAEQYYKAQFLAQSDVIAYQNFIKRGWGDHGYSCGILGDFLIDAAINSIEILAFKEEHAIIQRMVPYMASLYAIKKQVHFSISKINLITLATAEPVLWEPAIF